MPRGSLQNRLIILRHYDIVQKELENTSYTFEQKMLLIKEGTRLLELLEELKKEKRKKMEARGTKDGRPKKRLDSFGQPLYREPKVKKTEDVESKKRFLSGIQDETPKA